LKRATIYYLLIWEVHQDWGIALSAAVEKSVDACLSALYLCRLCLWKLLLGTVQVWGLSAAVVMGVDD